MARQRPEEALQRSVVELLLVAAPPDLVWWATANQRGSRARWEMGVLQAMGVRAGVADLCFVLPGGQFAAIELKAAKGRTEPSQTAWGAHVTASGGRWAVCRTIEQVIATLEAWGVRLRIAA